MTSVSLEEPVQTRSAPSPAPASLGTTWEVRGSVRMSMSVTMATWGTQNVWSKTTWGHATTRTAATVAGVSQGPTQTQLTEESSALRVAVTLTE